MSVQEINDSATEVITIPVQPGEYIEPDTISEEPLDIWQLGQTALRLRTYAAIGLLSTIAACGVGARVGITEASPAAITTGVISAGAPDAPASNVQLHIQPKLDQASTHLELGIADIPLTKHISVLGEAIGVNVQADLSNLNLVKKDGNFDSEKLRKYEDYLVAFKPELDRIISQVKDYYISKAVDGAATALEIEASLLALGLAVQRYLKRQKTEDATAIKDFLGHFGSYLGLIALGATCYAPLTSDVDHPHVEPPIVPDDVFNGTPLQGAGMTSPFKQLIDDGVKEFEDLLQTYNTLDKTTLYNMQQIFQTQYGQNTLPKAKGAWRIMVVDDFQGRYSMMRTDGHLAKISNVNKVAGLGDWSFSGSSIESPAADWLPQAFGRPGDVWGGVSEHDSSGIRSLLQQAGVKVSKNGKTQQLGKDKEDKVLITDLPITAPLGGDAGHETTPGSVAQMVKDAIAEIERTHPFVFMNHDVNVSRQIAQLGIVPLVLGGRSYLPQPSETYTVPGVGTSVLSISGSGAGLMANSSLSVRAPDNNCYYKYIDYYPEYGLFTEQQVIIEPDGNVILGDETPMNPGVLTPEASKQLVLRQGNQSASLDPLKISPFPPLSPSSVVLSKIGKTVPITKAQPK